MHAKCLVVLAAVGMSSTAGVTRLAIDIGLNGGVVTDSDVGDVFAEGDDLDAEFVTGDSGVAEEGHLA